jgi:uncharacterized protein (DUF2249 family)
MSEDVVTSERVVHVRDIDPRHRHTVIFQLIEHLNMDSSLQLVVDHNPKALCFQLEAKHGQRYRWTYLEQGPDIWRVRLQRSRQVAPESH